MEEIADNIKRIRKLKKLSQKQIALTIDIPQGQYSRIEGGKVVPTIPTLQKIAQVFEVSLAELVSEDKDIEEVDLSLWEKVKLIEQLETDEKDALIKMIDIALSRKRLKDSLVSLATA